MSVPLRQYLETFEGRERRLMNNCRPVFISSIMATSTALLPVNHGQPT